jgi:hypothetical protein
VTRILQRATHRRIVSVVGRLTIDEIPLQIPSEVNRQTPMGGIVARIEMPNSDSPARSGNSDCLARPAQLAERVVQVPREPARYARKRSDLIVKGAASVRSKW